MCPSRRSTCDMLLFRYIYIYKYTDSQRVHRQHSGSHSIHHTTPNQYKLSVLRLTQTPNGCAHTHRTLSARQSRYVCCVFGCTRTKRKLSPRHGEEPVSRAMRSRANVCYLCMAGRFCGPRAIWLFARISNARGGRVHRKALLFG